MGNAVTFFVIEERLPTRAEAAWFQLRAACFRLQRAVLPAWVELWPRKLLRAAAAGIPVIGSTTCGLRGVPNVAAFPVEDVDALRLLVAEKFPRD